jgi:filamentous hemagglutinin family protein
MRNAYLQQQCDYSSRFRILKGGKISLVVSALLTSISLVHAAPSGGTVTTGSANINQIGSITTINQSTQKASINWQDFSIGKTETVNFVQPSASSVTLNRVVGATPSLIEGAMNANGQVFLINPNGVLFANGSQINVGGLVASTLNLTDENFQSGNYVFEGNSQNSILNMGTITTAQGGYVAMMGKTVANEGTIVATMGNVQMASGEKITLDLNGNSLVKLTIDQGTLNALIENKGLIKANGGQVYLSTQAVDTILDGMVNNTGVIEVSSFTDVGGKIVLTSDNITLGSESVLDASGAKGGGEVLVGGDWQGSSGLYQAQTVTMESGAIIDASATDNGNGGKVVLWSDIHNVNSLTTANGSVIAKGANGGQGGQVETSGHNVTIDGFSVNTLSDTSNAGLWLIDPYDYTIGATQAATIAAALNTSSVTVTTTANNTSYGSNGISTSGGNITVSSPITKTGSGETTLTLQAHQRIANSGNYSIGSTGGKLNVVLWSGYGGGNYGVVVPTITTQGGHLYVGGGSASTTWNALSVPNGAAKSSSSANYTSVEMYGNINTAGGSVYIWGQNGVDSTNAGIKVYGDYNINAGAGDITLRANSHYWTLPYEITNTGAFTFWSGTGTLTSDTGSFAGGTNLNILKFNASPSSFTWGGTSNVQPVTLTPTYNTTLSVAGPISIYGGTIYPYAMNLTSTAAGAGILLQASGGIDTFNTNGTPSRFTYTTNNGPISLIADSDANGNGGGWLDGLTTNSGSGDVVIRLETAGWSTAAGSIPTINGTGRFTFESSDASFGQAIDTNWFTLASTLRGLTFGKATNTSNVTVSSNLSVAGPLSIYGNSVALNANITSSADGDIYVWGANNSAPGVVLASGKSITKTAGTGTLTFLSNRSVINNGSITASGTGKLNVVMSAEADDGTGYGVGSGTITTNGGHVWLGGGSLSSTWNALSVGNHWASGGGTSGNQNAIDISGNITTNGGDVMMVAWTGGDRSVYGDIGGINAQYTVSSGSGDIALLTKYSDYTNSYKIVLNTTGTVTLAPISGVDYGITPVTFSGTTSGGNLTGTNGINGLIINNIANLGGLTLGNYLGTSLAGDTAYTYLNTAAATVGSAISIAGPIAIYGGAVTINSALSGAGDITLAANVSDLLVNAPITNLSNTPSSLLLKAARHVSLGGTANITSSASAMESQIWADTDNSGDGIVQVSASSISTHGGSLKFGNNQTATINGSSVLVGGDVFFSGSSAQTISTGGGALDIYGETIVSNTNGLTLDSGGGNVGLHGVIDSGNQYTWMDETSHAGVTGYNWTWARSDAKNGTAGGSAVGDSYLVTITSRLENALAGLAAGYRGAWIGAYRANPTSSYIWSWADGSEAAQQFFTQNSSGGGGTAIGGYYEGFKSTEPNGTLVSGSESVGQFFGTGGEWNDLAPTTTFSATQATVYSVLGYVRETNLASSPITIHAGAGHVSVEGAVGGSKALASLTVNAASTTINAPTLVTTGAQTYDNALSVNSIGDLRVAASALTVTNANQNVLFKAAGNVVADTTVLTNSGDITLWSDSDASGGGDITINAGLTATGTNTITLQGSGTVSDGASGYLSASNLLLLGGAVTLDHASNDIGTLAASGVSSLIYKDSNALTIGTVGSTNGISAMGAVNVGTLAGDLTLSQNIVTTDATASAIILNAAINTAAGTSTGGDILISGSPTITTGIGGTAKLYTGSVLGSTGLTSLVGSGSGHFRYNSDETATNYTIALATNVVNAIYRESLMASATVGSQTIMYGDALVYGTTSGLVNGDTPIYTIAGRVDSTSGNIKASGTPYTVTASDLSGLGYTFTKTDGTLSVNTKTLNLGGFDAAYKSYNGDTTATINNAGTLSGVVTNDVVSVSNSGATFDTKNVGTGKTVTLNGVALAGADSANYTIAATATDTADITAKAITVSATASDKVYDATTAATATLASSDIIAGDTVTLSGTSTFADKSVGTAKTVTVASLNKTGTDAGNYTITNTTATDTADITAKAITVTATAENKVYDATTAATFALASTGIIVGDSVTLSVIGTFADKNVGTAKTVTVASLTKTGTDAENYTISNATVTDTADITAKAITVSATASDKVYDATTAATVTLASSDIIAGDSVTLSGTSTFADKNAGVDKTVTVASLSTAGFDGANYTISNTTATDTATITKASLNVSANAASKTYDKEAYSGGNGVVYAGFVNAETSAELGGTLSYGGSSQGAINAGVYDITLSGLSSDNYSITYTPNQLTINPKALSVIGVTASDKTYDGTAVASFSNYGTLSGIISGDSVAINNVGIAASFMNTAQTAPDANAGVNKPVGVTGYAISGTDAGNYTVTNPTNLTATINKATLSVKANNDAKFVTQSDSNGYNGVSYLGFVAGESSNVITGTPTITRSNAGTESAGTYEGVLVPDVSALSASNYSFVSSGGSYTIVPANELLVKVSNTTSIYTDAPTYAISSVEYLADATVKSLTPSSATGNTYTYSDGIGGTATFTIEPSSPNYSNSNNLAVGNYSLIGSGFSKTGENFNGTAHYTGALNVTAKALNATVNSVSKVYDGTNAVTNADITLSGYVQGDVGTFSYNGVYNGKNVGTNLGYQFNYSLAGTDVNNYYLSGGTTASGNDGVITPKALTINGVAVADKTYDGTNAATLSSYGTGLNGLATGDSVNIGVSQVSALFADKNAGTNKSVTISGYAISGDDASNYTLNQPTGATATITAKAITVSATAENKVYDATTAATATLASSDIIAGDTVTFAGTATFEDKNAGTAKTVTVASLTKSGTDAANYTFANTTVTDSADITAKAITITAIAENKVYDATTAATATLASSDIIAGDSVTLSGTSTFADKNVETAKTVTVASLNKTGTDAANYTIANTTATATADIARLSSVTWVGGSSGNWFDPANWAGGAVPDLSNVANVVIPVGVTVSFNTSGATGVADASGAVNIDALGSLGSLAQLNGILNIGTDGMTLNTYTQTGGTLTNAGSTNLSGLIQSGGSFSSTGGITTATLSQTDGAISTQGDLIVTDSFSQSSSGTITVGGNTSISDSSGSIVIGNIDTIGNILITSTGGDITQANGTALQIGGDATISASNGANKADITLGGDNDFQGIINADGKNILIKDITGGLNLGDIISTENAIITSTGGDVTQSIGTSILTGGSTTISASNGGAKADIILNNATNDFGGVFNADGKNITVTDGTGAFVLGNITATGTLLLNAAADMTQANGTTISVGGEGAMNSSGGNVLIASGTPNTFAAGLVVNDNNSRAEEAAAALAAQQAAEAAAVLASQQATQPDAIVNNAITNIQNTSILPVLPAPSFSPIGKTPSVELRSESATPQMQQALQTLLPSDSLESGSYTIVGISADSTYKMISMEEIQKTLPVGEEIRIPVSTNSDVILVNGGVRLPKEVGQEFYVVDNSTRLIKE